MPPASRAGLRSQERIVSPSARTTSA
jgi:hypothetical protein